MAAPGKSDHLTMAAAYTAWYKAGPSGGGYDRSGGQRRFCEENFLSQQALEGVRTNREVGRSRLAR